MRSESSRHHHHPHHRSIPIPMSLTIATVPRSTYPRVQFLCFPVPLEHCQRPSFVEDIVSRHLYTFSSKTSTSLSSVPILLFCSSVHESIDLRSTTSRPMSRLYRRQLDSSAPTLSPEFAVHSGIRSNHCSTPILAGAPRGSTHTHTHQHTPGW